MNFDRRLSLAIDRAVVGTESNYGLRRWLWRIRLFFLVRRIP